MLHSPTPMHIPDGFLSVFVSILLWAFSIAVVAVALKRVGRDLNDRMVPMMGVLAAAIFAGQMLNFAVAGGTSGHLMGAAVTTILLGPWAAVLVMTSVVSIQALIFQDGGLLALGANIFNMAVVGVAVAYFSYSTVRRLAGEARWGVFAAGFLAAWASVVVASLSVALQLAISGTAPANLAVPTMLGVHILIGIGEGLITVGALAFLNATRPDLLQPTEGRANGSAVVWVAGLLIALALAVLAPLASANPDGLEWVAVQGGFLENARDPVYNLIPDYLLPGVSNEVAATILAGVIGALLVFGMFLAVALLRRNNQTAEN